MQYIQATPLGLLSVPTLPKFPFEKAQASQGYQCNKTKQDAIRLCLDYSSPERLPLAAHRTDAETCILTVAFGWRQAVHPLAFHSFHGSLGHVMPCALCSEIIGVRRAKPEHTQQRNPRRHPPAPENMQR